MAKVKKDITLKDVITHIQGVKYELQQEMRGMKQGLQKEIKGVKDGFKRLEEKVDEGFKEAKDHRNALQEDLVATMQDIVTIRRHVGIPVRSE